MTDQRKSRSIKTTRKGQDTKTSDCGKAPTAGKTTKLDQIVAMLSKPKGASLAEITAVTGWQAHSVRGALAGSLKKKGHIIVSEKVAGLRRYRIGAAR